MPQGWFYRQDGSSAPPDWSADVDARKRIELAGMKAVMDHERSLGYEPEDISAEKRGWDIESKVGDGTLRLIEVKARVAGATTITVSKNEILASLNKPDSFLLAIVLVDGEQVDGPHYLTKPFQTEPDYGVVSQTYSISELTGNNG